MGHLCKKESPDIVEDEMHISTKAEDL